MLSTRITQVVKLKKSRKIESRGKEYSIKACSEFTASGDSSGGSIRFPSSQLSRCIRSQRHSRQPSSSSSSFLFLPITTVRLTLHDIPPIPETLVIVSSS
jgi:hypothetical protein